MHLFRFDPFRCVRSLLFSCVESLSSSIRLSPDRELVIMHERPLKRLTGSPIALLGLPLYAAAEGQRMVGEERKAVRARRLRCCPFTDILGDRIHQNGPNRLPSYTAKGDDNYLDGSAGWFDRPQGVVGKRCLATAGPSAQETTASAVPVQNTYLAHGHVLKNFTRSQSSTLH
jgi:hypothetical protein